MCVRVATSTHTHASTLELTIEEQTWMSCNVVVKTVVSGRTKERDEGMKPTCLAMRRRRHYYSSLGALLKIQQFVQIHSLKVSNIVFFKRK